MLYDLTESEIVGLRLCHNTFDFSTPEVTDTDAEVTPHIFVFLTQVASCSWSTAVLDFHYSTQEDGYATCPGNMTACHLTCLPVTMSL